MTAETAKKDDAPKPKQAIKTCPTCGGRGVIAWATDDVTCSTCDGAGTVTK